MTEQQQSEKQAPAPKAEIRLSQAQAAFLMDRLSELVSILDSAIREAQTGQPTRRWTRLASSPDRYWIIADMIGAQAKLTALLQIVDAAVNGKPDAGQPLRTPDAKSQGKDSEMGR